MSSSEKKTENLSTYSNFMWSTENQKAQTPTEVWETLEAEFGKMFDPCPPNPSCDGLKIEWSTKQVNYVNPPYNECGKWMEKCVQEYKKGKKVVCLIPCRSHTNWFHAHVIPYANQIRFIKNGVRFQGYKRKSPFSVCIVIYDPTSKTKQSFSGIDFYSPKEEKQITIEKSHPKKKQKIEKIPKTQPLPTFCQKKM